MAQKLAHYKVIEEEKLAKARKPKREVTGNYIGYTLEDEESIIIT